MNINTKTLLLGATLLLSVSTFASTNIIVDTKGIDTEQYHADMYECQQLSSQVAHQDTDSLGRDMLRSTTKGALIGAAGSAIGGGSGSKGAKVGAGLGLIGGALKHGREKRNAEANFENQTDEVMHNCMVGRGYTVLN